MDTTYPSSYSTSDMDGFFMVLGATFFLIAIIGYIVNSIFLAKIFKKAGVEGWKAWVPLYNLWVLLELGDQPGWISLLVLTAPIPVVSLITLLVLAVYSAIAAYKIGIKFGKDGVFVLLYIFLPLVWVIWLAVDSKAVWKGNASEAAPAQPLAAQPPVNNDQTPPSTPSQPAAM